MAAQLGMDGVHSSQDDVFRCYMKANFLPIEDPDRVEIPMEGSILKAFKKVDDEWLKSQKIQAYKNSEERKYAVSKEHFDEYCSPPVLDDNLEEGICSSSQKSHTRFTFPNKTAKVTNSCLKQLDSGARLLLRQISYGALMTSYLSELNLEDTKEEALKNLSDLFLSMADVCSRQIVSCVASRRSLYLKEALAFKNRATESKLLNISTIGPKIFGGKYFDILHSSAQNLKDAKETQHVRFRPPFNSKRKRYSSNELRSSSLQENKKARRFSPEKKTERKVYISNSQKDFSSAKKPRFQKGAGFRSNQQQ